MRHELSNEQPLATLVASSDEVGQATTLQQPNCPSLLLRIQKNVSQIQFRLRSRGQSNDGAYEVTIHPREAKQTKARGTNHELACVRPGGAVEALDGDGGARAEEGPW